MSLKVSNWSSGTWQPITRYYILHRAAAHRQAVGMAAIRLLFLVKLKLWWAHFHKLVFFSWMIYQILSNFQKNMPLLGWMWPAHQGRSRLRSGIRCQSLSWFIPVLGAVDLSGKQAGYLSLGGGHDARGDHRGIWLGKDTGRGWLTQPTAFGEVLVQRRYVIWMMFLFLRSRTLSLAFNRKMAEQANCNSVVLNFPNAMAL